MTIPRKRYAIIVSERIKARCPHPQDCDISENPSHYIDVTVSPWLIDTLEAIHRGEISGGAATVDLGRVIKALKEAK